MSAATCAACKAALQIDDRYCPRCGQTTARILWYSSTDTLPREGASVIPDGGVFYLVAQNSGAGMVRVVVDGSRLRGLFLSGSTEAWVEPHQCAAFPVQHKSGEAVSGVAVMLSEDGPRPRATERDPEEPWWETRGTRQLQYRAQTIVRVVNEEWVIGTPNIVFPPGVRHQTVRVWNNAERPRTFDTDIPAGYRFFAGSTDIDRKAPEVAANEHLDLISEAISERLIKEPDVLWSAGPDDAPVGLVRLPTTPAEAGPDIVIGIDFGTRNTGIRLRWRREIVTGKPADTVDIVTDGRGATRFPTEMAIHRSGRTFQWGSDVPRGDLPPDTYRVTGLKTALRTGDEPFISINPEWTCSRLVELYFEQIFARIDAFFASFNPPLHRSALNIRWVLTRPVLDTVHTGSLALRYEQTLLEAVVRCGATPESIRFVLEPVAAAYGICKLRAQELLRLGEGAAVAVVDSGGGTTDAAVGRLSFKEGRPTLHITAAASLRLPVNTPARPAFNRFLTTQSAEIGGDVLDAALAHRLLTRPSDVLETAAMPIPTSVDVCPGVTDPNERNRWEMSFVGACRLLKESFAWVSSQHLCAPRDGKIAPYERPAFPFRPEYEGIYLEQNLFGENVITPILQEPAFTLAEQLHTLAAGTPDGIEPTSIKQVFYVGGTCIEYFVRREIHRAFPNASRLRAETPEEARAAASERLNAVADGAVWGEDSLFSCSPTDLFVQVNDTVAQIIGKDEPLLPLSAATARPFAVHLEPHEELRALLLAALPDGATVPAARAYYKNQTDEPADGTLQVVLCAELGVVGTLILRGQAISQWRFVLVEGKPTQ